MTAATLAAAPTRDSRVTPEIGDRARSRAAVESADNPFKKALREAQEASPLEQPVQQATEAEPEVDAGAEAEDVAETTGEPATEDAAEADRDEADAPSDPAASAAAAPEAQDRPAAAETKASPGPGNGATRPSGEPRADDAAGKIATEGDEARPPDADASVPVRRQDHREPAAASERRERPEGGTPVQLAAPRAAIDAPPTVHRVNELLLTLDPRALQAAGVHAGGGLAAHAQEARTDLLMRHEQRPGAPEHGGLFAREGRPNPDSSAIAPGNEPRHEHEGRQPGRASALPTAPHAEAGNRVAASRVAPPKADTAAPAAPAAPAEPAAPAAPSPTGAAAISGAGSRAAEAGARSDAAVRGLARLAAGMTRAAIEPAGSGAGGGPGAGAPGGSGGQGPGLSDLRAGAAARPQTPDAPRAEQPFQAQLSRGLAAALAQKGGRITLRLAPEALGELKIDMMVKEGRVSARFEAATSEARDLLGKSMDHLRDVLHAKGLHVDRLEVRERAAEPMRSGHEAGDQGQGAPADAGGRTLDDGGGGEWGGQGREDPGSRSAGGRHAAERGGWTQDAAEAASGPIGGWPEDQAGSVWRFGVDAIA